MMNGVVTAAAAAAAAAVDATRLLCLDEHVTHSLQYRKALLKITPNNPQDSNYSNYIIFYPIT